MIRLVWNKKSDLRYDPTRLKQEQAIFAMIRLVWNTNWRVEKQEFWRNIEMVLGLTKDGLYVIAVMHNVIWAIQKTVWFLFCWLRAHATFSMFGFMWFSAFVRVSNIVLCVLLILIIKT